MSPRPTIHADRGARSTGRRRLAVAAAVTILGALAVACSSRADPQSSVPNDTAGSTLATTSATVAPDSTVTESTGTGSTGTDSTVTGSTAPGSTVPETTVASVPVPVFVDENGFDDHSVPNVDSIEELIALARPGVGGQMSLKFTIPQFDRPADAPELARTHLMDGNFYSLHDEWYYFRLLNGQPVPGAPVAPITDRTFATIAEIYRWAQAMPEANLPLGLAFSDKRLYASAFYDLTLHSTPRTLGVGSIVRIADPVAGQPDHWLIELEYSDVVTPDLVAQYFERLAPVLPTDVGSRLEWVVRSPQHEDIARLMTAEKLPYHDRVVHFRDLVPAGTVSVYSEGVTAGRLLYVGDDGAQLSDATATDIVITEHVPDWLPQASAFITSDPQTPLAHVNLLARNRGIPNASQSGIHDDAGLRQAARVRAHAIVIARGSTVQIALITRDQYAAWIAGQQPSPVAVPGVDISDMPLVVNLDELVAELSIGGIDEAEVATWRTAIGGKSAGFLTLLSTPGLTPPPDPLAITVRPYIEHLAPIRSIIAAAISDPDVVGSPRARWLVLEGADDYPDLFPTDDDASFAEAFAAEHPAGSPLGDVLAAGGVRALIESTPIEPETLAKIVDVLSRTYADYDDAAGLRFRSSSSVEDIEGFNGAGLYTSYTGYLHPESLEDPDDRDNTIERALLRAWSSYWTFEAFEERRLARIDHLSGAMGLTVHARFDDDLELNNGVVTFTYLPDDDPDNAVVEINVQAGAVDVTNPDTEDLNLPEVITVTRRAGEISIERRAASTLIPADERVLSDDAVDELFEQTAAVAEVWRSRINASLPLAQQLQTVVLDFEFKTMEAGWPQLAGDADPYPKRLVLRQVRSLDPGLRDLSAAVRALPVPRDVLMRASLIETVRCGMPGREPLKHVEILTDPLLQPDMGYSKVPLTIGDPPDPDATCTRTVEHASPDRVLTGLVAGGEAFVIVG